MFKVDYQGTRCLILLQIVSLIGSWKYILKLVHENRQFETNSGNVTLLTQAIYMSKCMVDVSYYPFDM